MIVSGAMCTMDTSQAQLALSQIDHQRTMMAAMIAAVIADFTKAYSISNRRRDELTKRINDTLLMSAQAEAKITANMDKAELKVKMTTRKVLHMVYHMAGQAWQLIEMAFGASKNAATRMIGFAISTMTQIISAGYAAAAQWAAAGPWGAAMAILNLAVVGINIAQQATMIAQQSNMESQPGIVGNILAGFPN